MDITDKKALTAELAGEVLEAMYYARITAPQDLYRWEGGYTEDAQDRFNELHDLVEQTINSYILNLDNQSEE